MASDQKIFLLTQKDVEVENPGEADLYRVGTVATVKTDHQTAKADSAGACICRRAGGFKYNRIADPYLRANITIPEESDPD